MKKNIITTTLAAAMVATTILTTGISAQTAEASVAQTQTQTAKIVLSESSKAVLKSLLAVILAITEIRNESNISNVNAPSCAYLGGAT